MKDICMVCMDCMVFSSKAINHSCVASAGKTMQTMQTMRTTGETVVPPRLHAVGVGLDARAMSYAELARWLTEGGYRTTKEDVENARRPASKLVEKIVNETDSTGRFVEFVLTRFPTFEAPWLFAE